MNDLPSLCYNLRLVCPSQTRPLALTVQIETAPSAAGLSPLSFLPNSNLMRGPDSIPAPSFSGSLAGYPIGVLTKSLFGDSLPARIVKVIAPTRRVHPRRRASFHPAPYSTRLPPSILRFHSQNPDGVCSLGTLPDGNLIPLIIHVVLPIFLARANLLHHLVHPQFKVAQVLNRNR